MKRSVYVHQDVNIEICAKQDASTIPMTGKLRTEGGGEFEFDELDVRIHSNGPRRWFPKKVFTNSRMRVTTNIETGEWKVSVRITPDQAKRMTSRAMFDLSSQFDDALAYIADHI